MKIKFLFGIILVAFYTNAQQYISGNFSPAKDFTWLIAYESTPTGDNYIADCAIENGTSTLQLPATAKPGIYKLVYGMPQDEYFIELIYNKKEDIHFSFSLEEGIRFTSSAENQLYTQYLNEIGLAEEELITLFTSRTLNTVNYKKATTKIAAIQNKYEKESENSFAHMLIKANRNYYPEKFISTEDLVVQKRLHFFDHIALNSNLLQSTSFLSDKIKNYVFSAPPSPVKTKDYFVQEVQKNIDAVAAKLTTTPKGFQVNLFYTIWKTAHANSFPSIEDYVFTNYLKPIALANGDKKIVDDIETLNRLRIGAVSPEVSWTEDGKKQLLSELDTAKHYVLVFWSSTCPHCLEELPKLHTEFINKKEVTVIAIGLESEKENWQNVTKAFPNFKHGISLNKWESTYVGLFAIEQTPTYFILDAKKRIVAKPNNHTEVVSFFSD